MVDTNTINPKKAKVDGIILPSFSSMITNHNTYNFNDVRVNHEIKGTMNYKSGTRNQVNLTRANLNTEIAFPSNTIHFNELSLDEDNITFDISVKGTKQRVSSGSYKLYIARETSNGLITGKELLYQATINDADPIILSKSKLTNWSTIINKFYNTNKINIYTGYTLYVEYTGVNGLYLNSSGKSKLGLLAYSTRPKFILTVENNATNPDGIVMNNQNGYGNYIQNTSTKSLNLRTNTNKINLSLKITDQNGRYIQGLKTDCIIQDFQEEHILWAKTYDANGEPEMLNGEYVLSERYYGVGEDIDERGVFTPGNGVTTNQLVQVGQTEGNVGWTWEVPREWFEFTNPEPNTSLTRMIKVTFIIGKNAQTFYGKRNPITNEVEYPELRESSGAEFSFWVNLISPRATEVKFPSKTIKFNEMNSNEDNITFDILDKETQQRVNRGSYKLYIARETSNGLITSKELLHQAKITNSNTISLPKSSLTNFETIMNKFYNTDKINIFTGYTLYVEYTGIEGVYLNSSSKSKLGLLAYSTKPKINLTAMPVNQSHQGGINMSNTNNEDNYIQNTSTSYLYMLGTNKFQLGMTIKDRHDRYIRGLKTDCIIQDFQQEHTLKVKKIGSDGQPVMNGSEYVLVDKHYAKGDDIDERGVFTPGSGITSDTLLTIGYIKGNAGWTWEIPDDWFVYMGKDKDNNPIDRVIKVTFIIGKNAQTFYGKTNPITNEVEYPDLREDSGAEFSFWVNLMVVE